MHVRITPIVVLLVDNRTVPVIQKPNVGDIQPMYLAVPANSSSTAPLVKKII